jgi:WD repeat-containing protein mio
METAIRYSVNATGDDERFLYVDVTGRSLQLSRITSRKRGLVHFESIGTPVKTPPFRAFDWSPSDEALVVVGQSSGEATLLRIEGALEAPVSFQVRSQRACNAVALSSQNLLAAGLDKVRNDTCLNIWDLQQRFGPAGSPALTPSKSYSEPLHKLASSEPITSIKFFRDDPQLLVAGVKGQFVRLYDLRENSNNASLSFATRCVNNLAIDGLDENYFASCCATGDLAICLWDRRMSARVTASVPFTSTSTGTTGPEVSLELKEPVEGPSSIWSLRFSKTKRGHLGVLSSNGHLKVYDFEREYISANDRIEMDNKWGPDWEPKQPQKIYLSRSQDIERSYNKDSAPQDESARTVSFDFTSKTTRFSQPEVMALTGDGTFKVLSSKSTPEPSAFSSMDFFMKGSHIEQSSHFSQAGETEEPQAIGTIVSEIRRRVETHNAKKSAFRQSEQGVPGAPDRHSSFENQSWNSELGFFESDGTMNDILALSSLHRRRCEAGYLFSPAKNIAIASDSRWLQSFWAWVERAMKISKSRNMIQDNLDLSFLGVHAIWMEDVPFKPRSLGPSSNKVSRHIEALTRRIKISSRKGHSTEYASNRKLCLHVSDLASNFEELQATVDKLVSQNKHTKAAAIALFADERKLAYSVLRQKSATQNHRMLAMAIAGAMRRARAGDPASGSESETEDDWSDTIAALAEEMVDPYARAILAYVRTGDWEEVVKEESLPLKYRVGIALRWLSDSALTTYISKVTKQAIADGDIEGVILTGTGTNASVELMTNYIRQFGDLQTAVLALSMTAPRYIDEPVLVRRFEQWRELYRHQINSWGLKYHRVRFDIGLQKFAVDASGRKLVETPKPQIAVVCGYCSQSLAQFDSETTGGATLTRRTPKHPLTSEKAAAIGTVCPKCGRHLPRCGVCDMWLGVPDPTHLSWYQAQNGAVDLGASMTVSVANTIGPGAISSPAPKPVGDVVKDTQNTGEAKKEWEEMFRKFTVFCIKCNHGFHAHHARQWFGGYAGRDGHKVCPVSDCQCVCDT